MGADMYFDRYDNCEAELRAALKRIKQLEKQLDEQKPTHAELVKFCDSVTNIVLQNMHSPMGYHPFTYNLEHLVGAYIKLKGKT